MKKTLVALAALAATGAFAQVTITGEFAYGYQTASTGGYAAGTSNSDAAGMGVDTSQLWFKASEDLGGGWKAGANLSLAGADRSGESTAASGNGAVTGRDATLDLTTPVGLLSVGVKKNADYLSGVAGLGAVWYSLDGNVQGGRTRRDQASFIVPAGAFKFVVSHQEAAEKMGLGAGSAGAAGTTGQRLNVLAVNYAAGAVVADAQYLMFDANGGASNFTAKDQWRLSGNYDLGVAKVGAGMTVSNTAGGAKVTDSLIGLSVPMGALTFGLNWAQNKRDDFTAADIATATAAAVAGGATAAAAAEAGAIAGTNGTKTGYVMQAQYNLSKTTYVIGSYKRWDAVAGAANAYTQTNLLLVKDF